jgi:hypothetical protein
VVASARSAGVDLGQVAPDGGLNLKLRTGTALGMLLDESAFTTVSRFRLLDGRLPRLDRADEVLVNPEIMAVTGWHVGDRVTDMKLFGMSDMEDQEPIPSKGTAVSLTIVGEARRVDEYVDEPDARVPRIYLTPAFGQTYPDSWFYLNDPCWGCRRLRLTAYGFGVLRSSEQSHGVSQNTRASRHADVTGWWCGTGDRRPTKRRRSLRRAGSNGALGRSSVVAVVGGAADSDRVAVGVGEGELRHSPRLGLKRGHGQIVGAEAGVPGVGVGGD